MKIVGWIFLGLLGLVVCLFTCEVLKSIQSILSKMTTLDAVFCFSLPVALIIIYLASLLAFQKRKKFLSIASALFFLICGAMCFQPYRELSQVISTMAKLFLIALPWIFIFSAICLVLNVVKKRKNQNS